MNTDEVIDMYFNVNAGNEHLPAKIKVWPPCIQVSLE
jgi:hypothetical protein